MNEIDLSSLSRAIARLDEALGEYEAEPARALLRDGLIQRFEFTYDLTHKMIRRVMEVTAAHPSEVDHLSFAALFRVATERGLVDQGWPKWEDIRKMRNVTSHTYDEDEAKKVVAAIPSFLEEARDILARLERAVGAR
ncbi:MAG: nucleotidyltransferase substrate binding protein [Novosphingobium sp.]